MSSTPSSESSPSPPLPTASRKRPRRPPLPPLSRPSLLKNVLLKGKMDTPPQQSPRQPSFSESRSNKLGDVNPLEPKLHCSENLSHGSTSKVGNPGTTALTNAAKKRHMLKEMKDNMFKVVTEMTRKKKISGHDAMKLMANELLQNYQAVAHVDTTFIYAHQTETLPHLAPSMANPSNEG